MTTHLRRASLALSLTLMMAAPALAKDAWNQTGDILGYKFLQASFADGSSQSQRLEFMYLGAADLQVFTGGGVRRVETQGLGTDFFAWQDGQGRTYQISGYPYENNHAPVYGVVLKGGATVIGKFQMLSVKGVVPGVAGRWSGVMAFPGGREYTTSLNVSSLYQRYAGCTHGNHAVRMDVAGFGYQDAGLLHCEKGYFQDGDHTIQTLFYDDVSDRSWFITLRGTVDFKNTVFQGFVDAIDLDGESEPLLGKFLLTRPPAFGE
ncbi:MAG: hypothetical protein R3F39_13375 [Myxococcota bacterium]